MTERWNRAAALLPITPVAGSTQTDNVGPVLDGLVKNRVPDRGLSVSGVYSPTPDPSQFE